MADKKDETKPDRHNWFSLAVSLAAFMVSVLSYKIARTTQEQSNTPRLVTTDMQLRAAGLGASGDQKTDVPVVTFRIQNLGTLTLKTVMTKVGSNIREQGDMSGTDAKPETGSGSKSTAMAVSDWCREKEQIAPSQYQRASTLSSVLADRPCAFGWLPRPKT